MNPQKREHDKIRKACNRAGLVLLTALCLWNEGITTVSARYQSRVENRNNSVTAADFYFESDLLDGEQHAVGLVEDGNACVTIPLRNYDDEQRCAETDIVYTVTVIDESNETEKITVADETGTLTGNVKSDANITVSGLQEGKIYTITATTNNTYQKTLAGTILVSDVISETVVEEVQSVIQEEEPEEMIVPELESEEQEEGETEEAETEMTEALEESGCFIECEEQESSNDSEAQMVESNNDAGSAIDIDGQSVYYTK